MDEEDFYAEGGAALDPGVGMGAPDPQLKQQWQTALADPKNQAFLLNFGLGLMMPNYGGNVGQAFAQGIAQGSQAAAGVEKVQRADRSAADARGRAQGNFDKRLAADREEKALDRASREKIAGMRTSSSSAAGMSKSDLALFNRIYEQELDQLSLSGAYNDDEAGLNDAAHARAMARFNRSKEAVGRTDLRGATSQKTGAADGNGGLDGLESGGQTGQHNTENGMANFKAPPPPDHPKRSIYDKKMKTPEGRAQLKKLGYDTRGPVEKGYDILPSTSNLMYGPVLAPYMAYQEFLRNAAKNTTRKP